MEYPETQLPLLLNSDIETISNLYHTNKNWQNFIDQPYTLDLLATKYGISNIESFQQLYDIFHPYHLCMRKYGTNKLSNCLSMAIAKHDDYTFDIIINYVNDQEDIYYAVLDSIEDRYSRGLYILLNYKPRFFTARFGNGAIVGTYLRQAIDSRDLEIIGIVNDANIKSKFTYPNTIPNPVIQSNNPDIVKIFLTPELSKQTLMNASNYARDINAMNSYQVIMSYLES